VLVSLSRLRVGEMVNVSKVTATQLLGASNRRPLKMQRLFVQNPAQIYAALRVIMPERFSGENMMRSETLLWKVVPPRTPRETIETLLFLISNNLQEPVAGSQELLDQKLLGLLKASGLLKTLIRVFMSSEQPSALALVDQLFGAAVRMGDIDVVSTLLQAGIKPDQPVPLKDIDPRPRCLPPGFVFVEGWAMVPLHLALCKGYTALSKLLIESGADIHVRSGRFSTLDLAVFAATLSPGGGGGGHDLLSLILQHQKGWPDAEWLSAIQHASLCKETGSSRILLDHYRDKMMALAPGLENDALVHAIRAQYDEMIQLLLNMGTDPNVRLESGRCALLEAVYVKRYDICETLFQYGCRPSPTCMPADGPTPLQFAAYLSETEIANLLLEHGADIDQRSGPEQSRVHFAWDLSRPLTLGTSALEAALHGGQTDAAFLLLEAGACLLGSELAIAIRQKLTAVADRLFCFQADTDDASGVEIHVRGESALEAAVATGQNETAYRILERDPSWYEPSGLCAAVHMAILTGDYGIVETLLSRRAFLDPIDNVLEGTALAMAAHFNNGHLVNLLFGHGIQPPVALFPSHESSLASYLDWGYSDTRDPELLERWTKECGWWSSASHGNPSHYGWHDAGELDIISPLEAAVTGNDEDIMVSVMLGIGYEPCPGALRKAASIGSLSAVQMLLTAGAHASDRDGGRATPLQAAVRNQHYDVAKALLENEADVNAEPYRSSSDQPCWQHVADGSRAFVYGQRTALQFATENGDMQLVDLLIDHGADVNAPAADNAGATALQLAAVHGYIDLARRLIRLGADVDAPGAKYNGRTALGCAAEHGRLDVLQLLLSHGVGAAAVRPSDNRQVSEAVELAEKNGHYASAQLLKRHSQQEGAGVACLVSGQVLDTGGKSLEMQGASGETHFEDWFDEFITFASDEEE